MQTLQVSLGARSYPIHIGQRLSAALLHPYIAGQQVMIVSNTTVAPLYLAHYQDSLVAAGLQVAVCILPDGERYKTLDSLTLIYDSLLSARFNRDCTIVALGGGVVGDMAGYAAASFQRGVDFIQVPTTLLSQVDSSVGGKTGVNHPLGKNMIGAFKQPKVVLADMAQLDTLPDRELSAGLAEVIKYALLGDADFLQWLEQHMPQLVARDAALLAEAVHRCCAHKARIVAADEHERGERALLNLGHTFGHAIESYMGYGEWLHGEAVAVGMLMAADLSMRLGWLTAADVRRVKQLLVAARLPVDVPVRMTPDDFSKLMKLDKKVLAGQLRLILLKRLGEAVITQDTPEALLQQTLSQQHFAVEAVQ